MSRGYAAKVLVFIGIMNLRFTCVLKMLKNNKNKLHLDYSDNGLGVALDDINLKNGLQNVENRILAIKGTITFDTKSNKGFKTNIIFPI